MYKQASKQTTIDVDGGKGVNRASHVCNLTLKSANHRKSCLILSSAEMF